MKCVSCGAALPEDARFCTECGVYQPEMRQFLADAPREPAPAPREQAAPAPFSAKGLFKLFKKAPSYHCETMQDIDRFSARTPVTLQLNDDEQRLFIRKGAAQISLPYRQILDFSVRRSERQDKNLLDFLQTVIGMNRRWIATLTYQAQEGGPVKHLRFLELEELDDCGYYDDEEKSGRAKRFEKALDQIIQHYHPCGQLD